MGSPWNRGVASGGRGSGAYRLKALRDDDVACCCEGYRVTAITMGSTARMPAQSQIVRFRLCSKLGSAHTQDARSK